MNIKTILLFILVLFLIPGVALAQEANSTNETTDTTNTTITNSTNETNQTDSNQTIIFPDNQTTNETNQTNDTITLPPSDNTTTNETNQTGNDTIIDNPGVLPSSPLWGIEVALDKLRYMITFDKTKRAELGLQIAMERLSELKAAAENGDIKSIEKAKIEHDKTISKVKEDFKFTTKNNESTEFKQMIKVGKKFEKYKLEVESATRNIEVEIQTKGELTPEQKAMINSVLSEMQNTTGKLDAKIKIKNGEFEFELEHESEENDTDENETEIEIEIEEEHEVEFEDDEKERKIKTKIKIDNREKSKSDNSGPGNNDDEEYESETEIEKEIETEEENDKEEKSKSDNSGPGNNDNSDENKDDKDEDDE